MLQDQVKDYDQLIKHNLGFFKRPTESSRRAIDQGAVLTVGSRKIPNAAHLRSPALQLSNTLVSSNVCFKESLIQT